MNRCCNYSAQIYAGPHKLYENVERAGASAISEADSNGFAVCICEGTEQISDVYIWTVKNEKNNKRR